MSTNSAINGTPRELKKKLKNKMNVLIIQKESKENSKAINKPPINCFSFLFPFFPSLSPSTFEELWGWRSWILSRGEARGAWGLYIEYTREERGNERVGKRRSKWWCTGGWKREGGHRIAHRWVGKLTVGWVQVYDFGVC